MQARRLVKNFVRLHRDDSMEGARGLKEKESIQRPMMERWKRMGGVKWQELGQNAMIFTSVDEHGA